VPCPPPPNQPLPPVSKEAGAVKARTLEPDEVVETSNSFLMKKR